MKRIPFCNLCAYEIYGNSAQSSLEDGNNFFYTPTVDAHTATIPLNESVIAALAHKTIILVTHQVEFLFEVDKILVMEVEGYHRITYKHENPEAVCLGDTLQERHRRVKQKGIF